MKKKRKVKPIQKTKIVVPIAIIIVATIVGATYYFTSIQSSIEITSGNEEVAVIDTNYGRIVFKFYSNEAPKTVLNFKKLASSGFFDNTLFHRVIPHFIIQGGDPNTKTRDRSQYGLGSPGYTIPAEFNFHKHVRGAVSMARGQDPDSAGSQFFIVVEDAPHLDGQYTVFGQVIEGMNVVDKIVNLPRDERDIPLQDVVVEKVYITTMPVTD